MIELLRARKDYIDLRPIPINGPVSIHDIQYAVIGLTFAYFVLSRKTTATDAK